MPEREEVRRWVHVLKFPFLLFLSLAVVAGLFLAFAFYWPNVFADGPEKAFFVSRGQTFAQIVDSLENRGVIRSRGLFSLVAKVHGGTAKLQVGKYLFHSGISNEEVFNSLRTGHGSVRIPVTIREGLTVRRQARAFARALGIDSTRFVRLANDPEFARSLGFPDGSLEGFLMPDTYAFPWQPDEREVVRRLAEEFQKFFTDSLRNRAGELGMTTRQVVTLASIVEGETHLDDERPLVAGVYYNRLRKGMRLEADPTIQFLLDDGPRRIYYDDLKIESPYNTYRNAGLPPGPVNSPGRQSMIAALFPTQHTYLFFVANGKGGHWFSSTYEAHMRNVRMMRRLRSLSQQ